jgi:hypothetical protein
MSGEIYVFWERSLNLKGDERWLNEKLWFFKTKKEAKEEMEERNYYPNEKGYAIISCPLCQIRLSGKGRWKDEYKCVWKSGCIEDFRIVKHNEPFDIDLPLAQAYRCPQCEKFKLPERKKANQNWKAYCRRRLRTKFYRLHRRLEPFIPTKDIHSIIFDYLK